jgi:alkaline phosphatase D
VADNSWRESSKNSEGEVFAKRKQAAVRAYFEWMPIRQVEMDDSLRIWRSFSIGTLFDLIMLDTRHYARDLTVLGGFAGIGGNSPEVEKMANWENRTIMGFEQEEWFYDQLSQSSDRGAAWRVVGQQVVFSHVTLGFFTEKGFNRDAWDGYLANRRRIFGHLYDNEINNTVLLSGDSHASWVSDLAWVTGDEGDRPYDPKTGEGAIGVELAGSAVTSSSPIGGVPSLIANLASAWLVSQNEQLQWQDLFFRGYYELDIGYESMEATFFGISDIKTRNNEEEVIATFVVNHGENKLARNPTVGGGTAKSGSLKNGKIEK